MANKPAAETGTTVTLKNVRLSYVHVWEPAGMADGTGKPKYSASIIIPKDDTANLALVDGAVKIATQIGKEKKWGGKIPAKLKLPLRDGDIDRIENEEYKNAMFVTASSGTKPGIVDRRAQPIRDETEVYSGVYANINVNFYAFKSSGSMGVACGLNHLQKVADGPALGGRGNPEDVFKPLEEDAEDESLAG